MRTIARRQAARRRHATRARHARAWLWTGPLGHLLGGTLDVAEALARHAWRTRKAGAGRSSR